MSTLYIDEPTIDPDTFLRVDYDHERVYVPDTRPEPADFTAWVEPVDWVKEANCAGMDPSLFFPPPRKNAPEAREACRGCVVRVECLEAHLGEREGIWGGTNERERQRLRAQRRRMIA